MRIGWLVVSLLFETLQGLRTRVPYQSVDQLQRTLTKDVFHYAKDAKKAAGRALGTLVEIVTYYLIRSWRLGSHVAIERGLAEYGNPAITHNVEYSLHPVRAQRVLEMAKSKLPLTSGKILRAFESENASTWIDRKQPLLTSSGLVRNSCVVGRFGRDVLVATEVEELADRCRITLAKQMAAPFAMFE